MKFLETLIKIWQTSDLRKKIFYTLFLLLLVRILAHIPIPGVNIENLQSFFEQNQIFGFLDIFSGGAMSRFSLILMGVGPYITASIVMQLLKMIVPALENLEKEGIFLKEFTMDFSGNTSFSDEQKSQPGVPFPSGVEAEDNIFPDKEREESLQVNAVSYYVDYLV